MGDRRWADNTIEFGLERKMQNRLNKLEELSEYEMHLRYNEFLDEVYELVNIAGLEYTVSRTLRLVDETAYRCGFNDWLDGELDETIIEVDGKYYDKRDFDLSNEDSEDAN